MILESYLLGRWQAGRAPGRPVEDATTGETIAEVSSLGLPLAEAAAYAREVGGPNLRALGLAERGRRLKALGAFLMEHKDLLYRHSYATGATQRDAWYDVDGGIFVLFSYAKAARNLGEGNLLLEDDYLRLSRDPSFQGRHVLLPKEGFTLQINAFNFPVWGLLEKFAPAFLAGVPTIVKPATPTAPVAQALVRLIVDSGLVPEGALQLVAGGVDPIFDALGFEDSVFFTGSKATADRLRAHPAFLERGAAFNAETDSLNAAILGLKATPEDEAAFVRMVAEELAIKAGQRCTAVRRVLVPRARLEAVAGAVAERLAGEVVGDPRDEATTIGPLVSRGQRREVERATGALVEAGARVFWRHPGPDDGAFFPPTLLVAEGEVGAVHEVEPFGPVATLIPYEGLEEAIALANRGGGSLVATVATPDPEEARAFLLGIGARHGRVHVLNARDAKTTTGHGSPLPVLKHGGPGRAGGGEELGGLLAVKHHMNRVALQADPKTLTAVLGAYAEGGGRPAGVHPFRKRFEDLEVGETLTTHRRTVTEADVVAFANLSWDHFYAHTDAIAARESLFGERVAHGYFVLSAAAGLFVDPAPGPVLANYGLEKLRFLEPVRIGDTIRARLTVKEKRPRDGQTGVVAWDVLVENQDEKPVARYTILTLVARRPGD